MWFIWEQFHSECPTTILYNEFENKTFKTTATYATNKWVNTLRPRQNGRHLPDDIFKRIFLNENVWISLKISLKFVPKVPINNVPALVLIMAWRCPGDKPLSEPMMVSLLTHICVTRPQWVNGSWGHGWSGLVEPKRQDISISCKSINWLWGSMLSSSSTKRQVGCASILNKIWQVIQGARSVCWIFQQCKNLVGVSVALLLSHLPNLFWV